MNSIAFSATNPCHVFDLAKELSKGYKIKYFSGYPLWKLKKLGDISANLSIHCKSYHTLLCYSLLKLPENLRPNDGGLFRWQDEGFDRSISKVQLNSSVIHGLPGQCLHTFRRAKELGITTVLNHASGPVEKQLEMVNGEYERAGISLPVEKRFTESYFICEKEEYALSDFHCAASSIVAEQLVDSGVSKDKIMVVPYGADAERFMKREELPSSEFKLIFAGALSVRKGIYYLLKALESMGASSLEAHFYGSKLSEVDVDFRSYSGRVALEFHGAVSQLKLAESFRAGGVLVLPSVEEAFGLVVVQALQCGLPCIVSDRVGAKDLIQHRVNGSIVPFGDVDALVEEIKWWQDNSKIVEANYNWESPAKKFINEHQHLGIL